MKRINVLMASLLATVLCSAQTLNVKVGCVDYLFPASTVGDMTFSEGTTLTIKDKVFTLDDVSLITTQAAPANTVTVDYASAVPVVMVADLQYASTGMSFQNNTNSELFATSLGGVRLNFQMSGITKVELESVDAMGIAGQADKYIITLCAPEGGTLLPGTDYHIVTLPADIYGGYRLSIYKDGQVAHYFGVHQTIGAGDFISPADLIEEDLEFADPDAPFVEDERPELDAMTKALLVAYLRNPTEENKQALLMQMGIRYDKVVARKKSKLRELEREAHHQSLVEEMLAIVDEMADNRDIRLEQQFLRLVDPRTDDNPNDQWMVLRGAKGNDPYIGYAPVTNKEYAAFKSSHTYPDGHDNYPVTGISYKEAEAYCAWLTSLDSKHSYRLPTEEDWILGAGHMPKDVVMNTDHVEKGLTPVDAYAQTRGACGGIDFWGNCWEWTSTQNASGEYIVKGGSWDSDRDSCRSEYSDDARAGGEGYENVGFRVVREISE